MGGFGFPNLATEPISGDSLTQYLRSLTNTTGQTGGNILGTGMGTLQGALPYFPAAASGFGTAMGTTEGALNTLQPSTDYWNAILAGNPTALSNATAPTANLLSSLYSGATNSAKTTLPAGGYQATTLASLPQAQAAQVGNYLLNLQPTAANALAGNAATAGGLAGLQSGIASGITGIGTAQGGLGLGTAGIGSNLLQSTLQALLSRRGQNVQQDMSNMGFLTGGLESLLGAGEGAAKLASGWGTPSDIDLKTGIIPLGVVDGIPVYAWRFKSNGELAMGVIAQEVRKVAPWCVLEGPDGYLRVRYDRLFPRFMVN